MYLKRSFLSVLFVTLALSIYGCKDNKTKPGFTFVDVENTKAAYSDLNKSLENEILNKEIELRHYKDALTINIADTLFFKSGDAGLKPGADKILDRIGKILKEKLPEKMIRIEGHTDAISIGKKLKTKYPNNWMLGAARATTTAEYFRTRSGIDPARMAIVSYSSYRPIASNRTKAKRAKNRRIEIIIMNQLEYQVEELKLSKEDK